MIYHSSMTKHRKEHMSLLFLEKRTRWEQTKPPRASLSITILLLLLQVNQKRQNKEKKREQNREREGDRQKGKERRKKGILGLVFDNCSCKDQRRFGSLQSVDKELSTTLNPNLRKVDPVQASTNGS
ncbi:hypothetical protein Dimus_038466 [Dionaea muscipula]